MVLLVSVWFTDMFMYAKPGDLLGRWQLFPLDEEEYGNRPPVDGKGGLSFDGRFYIPTLIGGVLRLVLQPQPHFVYVARNQRLVSWATYSVRSYLTPSTDAGMLLLRCFKYQALPS